MAELSTKSVLSEIQYISKIINTKDVSLVTDYGITTDYFETHKNEYKFICDHVNKYNTVPDSISFITAFDKFETVEVSESNTYLVESIVEAAQNRALATKFTKIRNCLMSGDTKTALELEKEPINITVKSYLQNVPDILSKEEAESRYNDYVDKMANLDDYYVSTGFPELDEALGGGWDKHEEFATYVARPGVGKSWMLDLAAITASNKGLRVGLYSGEMSKEKVGYRIDTLRSNISNFAISHGRRDVQNEYKKYVDAIEDTPHGPLFIATIKDDFDGETPTINDFKAFIKKYQLDIFLIDQQSLMEDINHTKNAIDKAGNIAKEIKLLQNTCKIPVITVCQQNRSGEQAFDKNGNKKDTQIEYDVSRIAGSDKVGQYSTIVIFLEYDKNLKILRLIPAKVRDVGCAPLTYAWDIDKGIYTHIVTDMNSEGSTEMQSEFAEDSEAIF